MTRRLPYIDWARGLAVLLMIHGHVLDAWTREGDRSTTAFGYLTIMGGFAAPVFLWLAGLSLVLAAEQQRSAGAGRRATAEAVVIRGLEVFILAFLFRLQAFVISPGGSPLKLFRVDILNIMGLGIAMAGLVWGACRTRVQAVTAYVVLAAGAAMVTPVLRTAHWVEWLPTWPSWYIRPMAEHTTFTGFPWWGFVFAGGAAGVAMAWARDRSAPDRLMSLFAAVGAALVGLGFYSASLPSIYTGSSFWTSSPTYFAIRLGVAFLVLAACYTVSALTAPLGIAGGVLARLGQSSLFVYWIHVELVYGTLAAGLRRNLSLWQMEVAYVAFALTMYAAVALRDRVVASWDRFGRVGRMPKSV